MYSLFLLTLLMALGCAHRERTPLNDPFVFHEDTLSYGNELVWEYHFEAGTEEVTTVRRDPPATYTLHCFVVARSARQFHQFAQFDKEQPKVDDTEYRSLVRAAIASDPARDRASESRVVIPGYANLRAFSLDHESMLKELCGGSWQSYFQRGNWRMVFPFSKRSRQNTATLLMKELDENRPPVVHLVQFPGLGMNHAAVLFDYAEEEEEIRFETYDPNSPEAPLTLTFDRETKTFSFPRTGYFRGGDINVYPVYNSLFY